MAAESFDLFVNLVPLNQTDYGPTRNGDANELQPRQVDIEDIQHDCREVIL